MTHTQIHRKNRCHIVVTGCCAVFMSF